MKPAQQVINGQTTRVKHVSSHLVSMSNLIAMSILVLFLTYTPTTIYGSSVPIASIAEKQYEFGEVSEGIEIVHDFLIKNRGTELLTISNVKTG